MTKKSKKGTALIAALFGASALLLAGSGIGAARAIAQYSSDTYQAELSMQNIGVTLNENGTPVSSRNYSESAGGMVSTHNSDLLTKLLGEGEKFQVNHEYDEQLTVTNSGDIDTYVRVVLDLYWLKADGSGKETSLSPQLIKLELGDGWLVDNSCSYVQGTGEQLILYYPTVLASGATSSPICDGIAIDGKIRSKVTQTEEDGIITTTYDYDGVSFAIDAEVDAIQTHNASDAALSAWGENVTVSGDTLSLN